MDLSVTKKPFNRRSFVSLSLLLSGLLLPISGIMNHELAFVYLSQERHFWMSVHNMAALIFSLAAIVHIVTNRGAILHYAKKARGVLLSKEAAVAIVVVFGVVGLIASHAFHVQ